MSNLYCKNLLALLACGGFCVVFANQAFGDRKQPQEPAGEVDFSEDGTAKPLKIAVARSASNGKNRKFTVAQGDEVAPPEPKIKVQDQNSKAADGTSNTAQTPEDVEDEVFSDSWDSYTDKPEELAADDVTKRIRVEDIVEPPSEYHFAAFGKEDPFVPPLVAQVVNSVEVPIISPLQRHPLSSMGLTGVWGSADGQRKALVTVPDFTRGLLGVVVKVGDPIGSSGGKVVAINKDGMSVREFHLAPDGSRIYEDRFLMLGDKPPIPIVSGNVVFRPGDSTGVVVDPVDRAAAQGIVVDPEGPVYDRLWQSEQIRSLRIEPGTNPGQGAPAGGPQGQLPSPAQRTQGGQAALTGQGAPGAPAQMNAPGQAGQQNPAQNGEAMPLMPGEQIPAGQQMQNQTPPGPTSPAVGAPASAGAMPISQPAAGQGSMGQDLTGQSANGQIFNGSPVSNPQQMTPPASGTAAPTSNPGTY